jgi:CHASE2 domain-containing sensor protein
MRRSVSGGIELRELDPAGMLRTEGRRAAALAMLVAVVFAALGSVREFAPAGLLAESPFDADLALRTLGLGWFEPDRTQPVAIVAIDDATYAAWGTPAVTPKAELVRLLEVTTAVAPVAVVLDIDLSFDNARVAADPGEAVLRDFLAAYAGPAPIILPKRVEPAEDGSLRAAASPFDPVVAANPHVAWAHASFQTSAGGIVREWSPWLALCAEGAPLWLPAVALRATPDVKPPVDDPCAAPAVPARRLLVGPRITDPGHPRFAHDARGISASLVLDPEVARDDAMLFGGRVVLIGATHASAGDSWLTVAGVYPGVELLANTVRHAPLQPPAGAVAHLAQRAKALLFFAVFAASVWWLRGIVALFVAGLVALAIVVVAAGVFDDLSIFDALESGLLLVVAWGALRAVADFIADWRVLRRDHPAGARGWVGTLKAVCVRQDAEGG